MRIWNQLNRPRGRMVKLGLNSASPSVLLNAYAQQYSARKADIEADADALKSRESGLDAEAVIKSAVFLKVYLESVAPQLVTRLKALARSRERRAHNLRDLQWLNAITRPARRPDAFKTMMLVQLFVLVEAFAMGAMLIEGGRVGVIEGLTYGVVFSAVNAGLALWCGFAFVRNAIYRVNSPAPEPRDGRIRAMGKAGLAVFGGLLGLLILSAARIRATGSHEHVFDFSEIGFLATFNDGVALAILAIALLASAVNLWKGVSGFSDPIRGLSEARVHAEEDTADEARDAADVAADDADERAEDFLERARDMLDALEGAEEAHDEDVDAINADIRALDHDIDAARREVLKAFENERDHRQRVTRRRQASNAGLDLSALDAQRLPLVNGDTAPDREARRAAIVRLHDVIAQIESARDAALSDIEAAHADFRAECPDLDLYFDDDFQTHGE